MFNLRVQLNRNISKLIFLFTILLIPFFFTGCGGGESVSLEEKIRMDYSVNDRLDKFYELQERYDNNKIILWLNCEDDSMWVTNFSIWAFGFIMPDLPETLATGGVIAIIYFVAWWIGTTLCGGGILAVLAFIGGLAGGVPGIPPAIAGIVFICIMFTILVSLFGLIF